MSTLLEELLNFRAKIYLQLNVNAWLYLTINHIICQIIPFKNALKGHKLEQIPLGLTFGLADPDVRNSRHRAATV